MESYAERVPIPNTAYALPKRPGRAVHHLPGPKRNWLTGSSLRFLGNDERFVAQLARAHGRIFKLPFFLGTQAVMMLGADANRLVLGNATKIFSNHGSYSGLGIFGQAVVTRDFEDHYELRQLLAESFTPAALAGYFETITELTHPLMNELEAEPDSPINLYPRVKQYALRIAGQVFAGLDLGPEQSRMSAGLKAILDMPSARVPLRFPGGVYDRGMRGLSYANAYFASRVPERREGAGNDLFTRLCRAENDRGERLGEQEVVDNVVGAMIAGHDTSTVAMAALSYELARNPAWQERLREDCFRARAASGGEELSFAQAGSLVSVEWCVKEVMRLYTPVRYIGRRSIEAFEFDGHVVPKNTAILISIQHTHHDPAHFAQPEEFKPERFAPEHIREFDPYAWAPFGKGAHLCLGMGFAMLEIKAFLCALLTRFSLAPCRDASGRAYPLRVEGLPVSKPIDGVPIRLTPLRRSTNE